jgi:phosphonate transport system permease protein
MKKRIFFISSGLIILALLILNDFMGQRITIAGSWNNLVTFVFDDLIPPDWRVIESEECGFFCSAAWLGMWETIKIAFVSTVIGFVFAIFISVFAALNLSPIWVSLVARSVLAAMRTIPSIIWATLFLVAIGLGPVAGIFAMTFYTIGYLGKLQYEAIEGMQSAPLEAAKAMGMRRHEVAIYVAIPEVANHLISQLIFMFEYNVRHGTVLGLVGAGGIGLLIQTALISHQYSRVTALLIVIFVVVLVIEGISMVARSFVTEEGDVKRPSWFTVFHTPRRASRWHHSDDESE